MACQIRRFSVTKPSEPPRYEESEAVTVPLNTDFPENRTQLSESKSAFAQHRNSLDSPDQETRPDDVEARLLPDKVQSRISVGSSTSEENASETQLDSDAYIPLTLVDGTEDINKAVAERGRQYAGRKVQRLVYKDGTCNIAHSKVTERNRKYLVDIFTTVVDMKWRYNIIMFSAAFVLSWFFFALIWFIIALVHGDVAHKDDEDWRSCVSNVYDFQTALLYSIETQHTIGYGYRYIEPKCPDAFIVLMVQSCLGVFIQALMAGIIFAKLSIPKRRAHTIMFSKKAVISKRDNEYSLLFRVGDMRKSHFVSTSIRAILIKDRITSEGECIPLCQFAVDIQTETSQTNANDGFVFLVWPVTAVHKINENSPLWGVSAESLLKEKFELIVILQGVVEATGMTTQIRTSYLPSEILWAHRPASLFAYQRENGVYRIDYSQFHAVVPVTMPDCSAKEFAEQLRRASFSRELALKDESGSATSGIPPSKLYGSGRGTRWKALRAMRTTMSLMRRNTTRRSLRDERQSTEGGKSIDSAPAELQDERIYLSI